MNSKLKASPVADSYDGGLIATVNDDVWTEILVRLPAKSLTRIKLVCKHWFSLISGDQFGRLHTLRHQKPQHSLILRTRTSKFFYFNPITNGEKLMISFNFSFPNPKILSSCNGLLLLQCDDDTRIDYYVYNPTTNQRRKIILTYDDDYPSMMGLNLAFDPSKSPHYKIVCVKGSWKGLGEPQSYLIEVYDSENHTWKLCLGLFTDSGGGDFSAGVYWNNSIYWISNAILYFDVNQNIIGYLPRPDIPFPDQWGAVPHLQESNGHLYHFVVDHGGESVALWKLQGDDHCHWLLKYHDRIGHRPRPFLTRILRFIAESEAGETSILVTHVPGKIRAYRFLDRSLEELVDLTDQPFHHEQAVQFDHQHVYQFGESLAPV